jgi:hypothetical protein
MGSCCFQQIYGLVANGSGIPPQRAGSSRKPVDEGDLRYVACKVDMLYLAQIKCLEIPEGSLKSQKDPR